MSLSADFDTDAISKINLDFNYTPIKFGEALAGLREYSGWSLKFGIGYIIAHFFSLLSLYVVYPFITLPFIFGVAPLISLIFVRRRLKKEGGLTKETFSELTYEYNQSPLQMIKSQLKEREWTREKEILKLLIVLLPISLYLLQVILKMDTNCDFFSIIAPTKLLCEIVSF